MRWATYQPKEGLGADRVGLVLGEVIYGLEPGTRLIDLLGDWGERLAEAGERARSAPSEVRELSSAVLRPPIPAPPSIRDFSSFLEHYRAGIAAVGGSFNENWFSAPVFYFQNVNNVVGSGGSVRIPSNTQAMDYELEVAAVIGRGGMDIHPDEAEKHIAGYCVYNDWSARDLQHDEMARAPIGPAKGKDSANSLGPFLVTPDELESARAANGFDLKMTATVNGREYSNGNWSTIYWSFAEMIAFASRNAQLVPGDVIGAGTVGTGCILELSTKPGHGGNEKYPWLKDGDEVVLEVERLGQIRNRITVGAPITPLRETRNAPAGAARSD